MCFSFFLYNFIAKVVSSFRGVHEWKITENAPRRQVVSVLFSSKKGGNRNEMR